MPLAALRPVHWTVDESGRPLVRVSIPNCHRPAVLLGEDYAALMLAGVSPNWFINQNGRKLWYVRTPVGVNGRPDTVARLILGVGKGARVKYVDGNRLNLRRENLYVEQTRRLKKASGASASDNATASPENGSHRRNRSSLSWVQPLTAQIETAVSRTTMVALILAEAAHADVLG